eukprot:753414-Hanusia_phi.AAC.6
MSGEAPLIRCEGGRCGREGDDNLFSSAWITRDTTEAGEAEGRSGSPPEGGAHQCRSAAPVLGVDGCAYKMQLRQGGKEEKSGKQGQEGRKEEWDEE